MYMYIYINIYTHTKETEALILPSIYIHISLYKFIHEHAYVYIHIYTNTKDVESLYYSLPHIIRTFLRHAHFGINIDIYTSIDEKFNWITYCGTNNYHENLRIGTHR